MTKWPVSNLKYLPNPHSMQPPPSQKKGNMKCTKEIEHTIPSGYSSHSKMRFKKKMAINTY